MNEQELACGDALAALARGGDAVDWEAVDRHLATCAACAGGLARFTAAIDEQFSASRSLALLADTAAIPAASVEARPAGRGVAETIPASASDPIAFPSAAARVQRRRRLWPRLLVAAGAAAAAIVLLSGAFVLRSGKNTPAGETTVAEFRPEFVQSVSVTPERPNQTYRPGELVTICIHTLQPERVVLSVLEGHTTFKLLDTNAGAGEQCYPYRVAALRGRATLRLEAFFGQERVAREDVTLLPAESTPAP